MGKKDRDQVSDSGTFNLDVEEHKKAIARKAWKNRGGAKMPLGEYPSKILAITRDVSKGDKTAGAPNYRVEMEIEQGEYKGNKLNAFYIAHGSVASMYYQFLEATFGIATEDFPIAHGKVQVPYPTQAECDARKGVSVIANIDQYRPRRDNPEKDSADVSLVIPEAGAKSAKSGKKSKIAK